MKSPFEAIADAQRLGMEFCLLDVQVAHTLLDHADITREEKYRRASVAHAEDARRAVFNLLHRIGLDAPQYAHMSQLLERVDRRIAEHNARTQGFTKRTPTR